MARQPAAKRAPRKAPAVPAASTPAAPKADPLTLQKVAALSSDIRTLAVNLTVLLVILIIVPVVLSQFARNEVLVDPIAIPEAMQASGLTPEIAARRLWDGLGEVKEIAGTAKKTINAIPDTEQVSFSIPDSGLSIDSLIYYVRRFFNLHETRVGGEFRCGDPECTPEHVALRLRIVRNDLVVRQLPPIGAASEADYFRTAASEVMSILDPFTAVAARAETEPARAKALAYQLVARGQDAKWAHNLIGNLLLSEGKANEAIPEYETALALDPNFHLARTNLGNALLEMKNLPGARAAYERVNKADAKYVFAITGLASLAEAEGRADEAVRLLLDAYEADSTRPDLLVRAANVERDRGNGEQAIARWRQALRVDPGNRAALANMALYLYETARFAEAEAAYGAAADFAPEDSVAVSDHADMLIITGDFSRALARADQAIALSPKVAGYHITRGRALVGLTRHDDALAAFAAAEALEPANAEIPYFAADAYSGLDRLDDAAAAYRKVIALSPDEDRKAIAGAYVTVLEARIAAALSEAAAHAPATEQPTP